MKLFLAYFIFHTLSDTLGINNLYVLKMRLFAFNNLIHYQVIMFLQDKCVLEGADSLMMHELVLGGHLYLQLLKEKMADWLVTMKSIVLKKAKAEGGSFNLTPEVGT